MPDGSDQICHKMKKDRLVAYGRSVGTYFAASLIPMLLMALVNPLIALNMSPEDYAVYGYYNSFTALITPVIVFYMLHYYTKRYYEVSEAERLQLRAMLFKALIFFSFAVSVLCLVLLAAYIRIFNSDSEFPTFPYLALMVFAVPLSGIYKLEQTEYRMSRNSGSFFRLTVAAGVILTVTNLVFVVIAKWGAAGKLLAPLVANLLVFIYLVVRHRRLFAVRCSFSDFRKVLTFCLPLAAGAALGYFFNGYDRTYLEGVGDVTEYGYYIVGAQIAGYLTVLSTAVTSTFQPDIYEAIAKNDRRALWRSCIMQIGLIAVTVAVFIIFCPLIIKLLTAGRYVDSTIYARIVSVSVVTSAIYYVINNYTIAKGYPRIYLYTTLIGSAATVAAYPPVVGRFGFVGGAVMVGMSFVMLAAVNLAFLAIASFVRRHGRTGRHDK